MHEMCSEGNRTTTGLSNTANIPNPKREFLNHLT